MTSELKADGDAARDERLVRLDGVANFRDLGGYRTRDGGVTRWGLVYRSGALHGATAGDVEVLGNLGIKVAYDLRSEREQEEHLSGTGIRRVSLPVFQRDAPRIDLGSASDPEAFLTQVYRITLDHGAPVFAELLAGLAAPDGLPAVFHCTVGKDRTGLAAALLLDLLGVDDDDIVRDYELTSRYQPSDRVEAMVRGVVERLGADPAVAVGVFGTPRRALTAALDDVREHDGGVAAYLVRRGGLAESAIDDLRRVLVTDRL